MRILTIRSPHIGRPTPVKLCHSCDGKKTIGLWDGNGEFAYTVCAICCGEGTLPGPQWGFCQYCEMKVSYAYNCCILSRHRPGSCIEIPAEPG